MQKITPFLWFDTEAEAAMKDPERSKRVFAAMMKMTKIDIAALQRAYDQA
jgi:predicted 3-demethylubiquinone-9 3-methyltransferase (glyoxalase superfamily)